jgi:hypothetical protein
LELIYGNISGEEKELITGIILLAVIIAVFACRDLYSVIHEKGFLNF